jgi:hypothetical protein
MVEKESSKRPRNAVAWAGNASEVKGVSSIDLAPKPDGPVPMSRDEEARTESSVTSQPESLTTGKQGERAAKGSINYEPIKAEITSGRMNWAEAAKHFNVKENTLRVYAIRHRWHIPQSAIKTIVRKQVAKAVEAEVAAITQQEIEAHKRKVFDIATESVGKFKAKAPKSFKDLDTADRIARRSAGIDDDGDDRSVSLILCNERLEAHGVPVEPIEAHEVQQPNESHATLQPDNSLGDAGQQGSNAPIEAELLPNESQS